MRTVGKIIAENTVKIVLLLFAISFIAFFLISLSPVDPVEMNVGQTAYLTMSSEKRAQLAEYWGVGVPVFERYINWLGSALHGDLGMSLRFNAPVTSVIAQRAGASLALMGTSWIFSGLLGLLMGITAGVHRGSFYDRLVKGYCYLLASTPTFWLALLMLIVFSVWLGWFPLGFAVPIGVASSEVTFFDLVHHTLLPAITLSMLGVANIALHTREKTIDVLETDYVRFARTRGLSTWQIMRRHGLRNLALPAITLQFASVSEIFGGSVLVEQVFSYPGLGQATITAGVGGDAALLAGITLFSAALVFTGNLIANILYGVIDPRVRKGAGRV